MNASSIQTGWKVLGVKLKMVNWFGPGETRGGGRGSIQAFLTMLPFAVQPDVSAFISSEKRWEVKGGGLESLVKFLKQNIPGFSLYR